MGFPCSSADKESACNAGDLGSIPGLGRSLGEGKGYPLQCSGLENSDMTDFHLHFLFFHMYYMCSRGSWVCLCVQTVELLLGVLAPTKFDDETLSLFLCDFHAAGQIKKKTQKTHCLD